MAGPGKLTGVETTKQGSRALRGAIAAELGTPEARGGVTEATYNLLKFHGTYEQFDRDTATARKQAGEDKDWSFMVRVRAPAGRVSGAQWLALDGLADARADATLRLTTRQGVQYHGVIRGNLRPAIGEINRVLLTTFAACGDVVRNVITTAAPRRDPVHARLEAEAFALSAALLPRSRAHHQIFVEGIDPAEGEAEEDALYGPAYLPRKFKIALAHPSDNTPDILANDLGFLAVAEPGGEVTGWIVTVGGGMGMTHGKPNTFPRLADPVALVGPDEVLEVARAVVRLFRDHGDRTDRKHARLKYVVEEKGAAWVRHQLSADLGRPLAPPLPLPRLEVPELLGWHPQGDGRFWLGLPIASGRIADIPGGVRLRSAIRAAITRFGATPIVTPQQDLLLTDLAEADRAGIEALLRGHGVTLAEDISPLARWTLACVALPTCGQALTEGERVRNPIVAGLEAALDRHGLQQERISLRITGCPNGCARPYAGDIGVVGRAPGLYTLFVGGDFEGTRLSWPLADKVKTEAVAATLDPLLAAFAARRAPEEGFGDFCHRLGQQAARDLLAQARGAAA